MMGWYGDGSWMVGGWFGMVVFWVALAALLFFAVGAVAGPFDRPRQSTPLEILQRRYAKGELSDAEYEQARLRLT